MRAQLVPAMLALSAPAYKTIRAQIAESVAGLSKQLEVGQSRLIEIYGSFYAALPTNSHASPHKTKPESFANHSPLKLRRTLSHSSTNGSTY